MANGRFNNAANRAYYGCYQAAIVAILRANFNRRRWSHDEVQAIFAGQLISRRKLYPSSFRRTLSDLAIIRVQADYEEFAVSRRVAEQAMHDASSFINRVLG